MFAKPAKLKPAAAIKNSERKNVLAQLEKQLGLADLPAEDKQRLLPKGVQVAKGISHGEDKFVAYIDAGVPIWIVLHSTFVPTVALLASLPPALQLALCPVVYTRSLTWQFLHNGADFMIPGILGEPPQAPKGSAVQIRAEDRSLIATGIALLDLGDLKDKGKCVQTISVAKDKLTPNVDVGEPLGDPSSESGEPAASGEAGAQAEPVATPAEQATPEQVQPDLSKKVETLEIAEGGTEDAAGEEDAGDLTPAEVDDAFIYAIQRVLRQPKIDYPMPMATMATLLASQMPYEHPQLQLKNTSFKKMAKLLKHAEKKGLLSTRERNGGELVITGSNVPTDPESIRNLEKPQRKAATAKPDKMKAVLLFRPTPAIRRLLPETQAEYVDAAYLKRGLAAYIAAHELAAGDHKTVVLDDDLRKALGQKAAVVTVSIGDVTTLAAKQSSAYHRVTPLGQSEAATPLEKGAIPVVEIKTERRGGNKVVTLVGTKGLRGFHVDPPEFAEELRHACAGSSTIATAKGVESIVVQGNHVAKIVRLLECRGLKQSWIKC